MGVGLKRQASDQLGSTLSCTAALQKMIHTLPMQRGGGAQCEKDQLPTSAIKMSRLNCLGKFAPGAQR